jgi:hypothetical protein
MSFNILTIRTAEFDDGALYPVLGDAGSPIELEQLDGADVQRLVATALEVHEVVDGKLRSVVKVPDIKAHFLITDARIAIACEKYDKGGGWVGTSLAVPVLNAISYARAAARRRGKMLVGHVRYPWLKSIGFSSKTNWLTSEALRLQVSSTVDGTPRWLFLDVTLPKNVDASKVAVAVAQRAARYRLAHDPEMTDEERQRFLQLASAAAKAAEPKKFVFFELPTFYKVNRATAYPKVREAESVEGSGS